MKRLGLALALVGALGNVSAELSHIPKTNLLLWEGNITKGFAKRVSDKFIETGATTLAIESGGGSMGEAMQLGNWLRKNKINTLSTNLCASACVSVLAGGAYRVVSEETNVGVHAFHDPNRDKLSAAKLEQETQLYTAISSAYMTSMGVSHELQIKAASIPSNSMAYLSISEMKKWGLIDGVLEDLTAKAAKDEIRRNAQTAPPPAPRVSAPAEPVGEEVVFVQDWKQNKNTAGVLLNDVYLDSLGVRFVHRSDDVDLTICTDRPQFQSSAQIDISIKVKVSEDEAWKWGPGKASRAKRAKSCWDLPISKKLLGQIKNGEILKVELSGVTYFAELNKSALTMNKAWAYKERKTMKADPRYK